MSTKVERDRNKKLAQTIMGVNGIDYDEWLNQQHSDYIAQNADILMKGVKSLEKQTNVTN